MAAQLYFGFGGWGYRVGGFDTLTRNVMTYLDIICRGRGGEGREVEGI